MAAAIGSAGVPLGGWTPCSRLQLWFRSAGLRFLLSGLSRGAYPLTRKWAKASTGDTTEVIEDCWSVSSRWLE